MRSIVTQTSRVSAAGGTRIGATIGLAALLAAATSMPATASTNESADIVTQSCEGVAEGGTDLDGCIRLVNGAIDSADLDASTLTRPAVEYLYAVEKRRVRFTNAVTEFGDDSGGLRLTPQFLEAVDEIDAEFVDAFTRINFPEKAQDEAAAFFLAYSRVTSQTVVDAANTDSDSRVEATALVQAKDDAAIRLAKALGIGTSSSPDGGPNDLAVSVWADEYCLALDNLIDLDYRYEFLIDAMANGTVAQMVTQVEFLRSEAKQNRRDFLAVPEGSPAVIRRVVRRGIGVDDAAVVAARRLAKVPLQPTKKKANTRLFKKAVNGYTRAYNKMGPAVQLADDAYPDLCQFGGGVNLEATS